jgi:hypothetical protein
MSRKIFMSLQILQVEGNDFKCTKSMSWNYHPPHEMGVDYNESSSFVKR